MYDVQVITSRPDYDPRTLQFLGRGAFGEVYKVTDKSGKAYAIKMLKELETSDVNALEKFKRETESLRYWIMELIYFVLVVKQSMKAVIPFLQKA